MNGNLKARNVDSDHCLFSLLAYFALCLLGIIPCEINMAADKDVKLNIYSLVGNIKR